MMDLVDWKTMPSVEYPELFSPSAENEPTITRLVEQLRREKGVIPFVGNGMSMPMGYPSWLEFLKGLAHSTPDREIDLLLASGLLEEAAEELRRIKGPRAMRDHIDDAF